MIEVDRDEFEQITAIRVDGEALHSDAKPYQVRQVRAVILRYRLGVDDA